MKLYSIKIEVCHKEILLGVVNGEVLANGKDEIKKQLKNFQNCKLTTIKEIEKLDISINENVIDFLWSKIEGKINKVKDEYYENN